MRVFITGATGFLGYHIAKSCISKGYEVLCLKRNTSISLFNITQENKIVWINSDNKNWENSVVKYHPDILIHCAWNGIYADDRNNPIIQSNNINFSEKLFKLLKYRQIIVLGSQEEYGVINSIVNEEYPLIPLTEYAKAKVHTCVLLRKYAEENGINWQWIRVFTVYGEKQKENWLVPSIISKCLDPHTIEIETTKGEQIYSYLYSSDFANAILLIIGTEGKSGIYNLSSSTPTMLKELFTIIRMKTNSKIIFKSTLPYREYQSMMIMGDSTKFKTTFGEYEQTSLNQGLNKVIREIKNKINEGI